VLVARFPDERFVRRVPGSELVGLRYEGPFDGLGPGASVEHEVVPWDEVSLEEGTGIVHIATGCGREDFDLGRELGIPVVEEDLQPYDLYTADEAFFTSTSPCILPVTRVDRRPIGAGVPGPVAQRLLAAWSETVGVDIVAEAKQYASREELESPRGS